MRAIGAAVPLCHPHPFFLEERPCLSVETRRYETKVPPMTLPTSLITKGRFRMIKRGNGRERMRVTQAVTTHPFRRNNLAVFVGKVRDRESLPCG